MGQKYTVQILTNKEFDSLPYKGISNSLGIADPEKGLAFVRDTGVQEWNLETLSHEIDHLVSKNSNHKDEYGIYHKRGGDIATTILPIVAGILAGPLGPIAAGAISAGTSAIAQNNLSSQKKVGLIQTGLAGLGGGLTASGMGAGINAAAAGGKSYLGQLAGGLVGTAATTAAPSTAGIIGTRGSLLGLGTVPSAVGAGAGVGATIPGMGGAPGTVISTIPGEAAKATLPSGASVLSAAGPSLLGSSIGSGVGSSLAVNGLNAAPASVPQVANNISWAGTPAATTAGAMPIIQGATTPNLLGNTAPSVVNSPGQVSGTEGAINAAKPSLLDNLWKEGGKLATPTNILGAGALYSAMSPQVVKQPEFQMPESVAEIRSKLLTDNGALTPAGQQAQMELGKIMSSTPQDLYASGTDQYYQTVLTNVDNEYARQQQNLAKQWNAIDPNYMQNGEYQDALDRLNKSYMEVKNNYVAQEEQRRFELARTTQYQAIQDSLGVDKNTMDGLLGLSGLDVQTAAMIYGAKVEDVKQLRENLGTLGADLLVKGTMGAGAQKVGQGGINITFGGQPAN